MTDLSEQTMPLPSTVVEPSTGLLDLELPRHLAVPRVALLPGLA